MKSLIHCIILVSTTILLSCNDSSSNSKANNVVPPAAADAPTVGADLTGEWKEKGIECYDPVSQTVTAQAVPSSATMLGTTSIQGNNFKTVTSGEYSAGACTVERNNTSVFTVVNGDVSAGTGVAALGESSVAVTPLSTNPDEPISCTITTVYNMQLGEITPATNAVTYTHGEVYPAQELAMIFKLPLVGIRSDFQVVDRPTDVCFVVYERN